MGLEKHGKMELNLIIKLCFNDCKSKLLSSALFIIFRAFKLKLTGKKAGFSVQVNMFNKTVPVTFTKLFLQKKKTWAEEKDRISKPQSLQNGALLLY